MNRRRFTALAWGAVWGSVGGCALNRPDTPGNGHWVDLHTGQPIPETDWLPLLKRQDYVLLGEQHDRRDHHMQRGRLLSLLSPAAVVAEHLPMGRRVDTGATLLERLGAAGFDAKGWSWPQHEPLFQPLLDHGLAVWGGNAPLDWVRKTARIPADGPWPAEIAHDIRSLLDEAPLSETERHSLQEELMRGHCGKLPADRMPAMTRAQALRDAAMAHALMEARVRGSGPVALVAGNGHVRLDHGVPRWLQVRKPGARMLSIGLFDSVHAAPAAAFDIAWILPVGTQDPKDDPCAKI